MYSRLSVCIVIICLALSGCSITTQADNKDKQINSDKKEIGKAMEAIIDALNHSRLEEIQKYLSPTFSQFPFDGKELFSAAEAPPSRSHASLPNVQAPPLPTFNVKLATYNIQVYGNCAIHTGYMSGSVVLPPNEEFEGTWRMNTTWIKENERWLIVNHHISKLNLTQLNYLIQLPEGYYQDPDKKWPVILFLHGIDGCGNDLELVKAYNIPKIAEAKKNFPFITVSPQCPANSSWDAHLVSLNALIDKKV